MTLLTADKFRGQQRMGKDKKADGGKKHKSKQSHNDKNPKKALKPNKTNRKHEQINHKNTGTNNSSININSSRHINTSSSYITPTNTTKKGLSALQTKFAKKLQGSRFRIINESIYTKPGADSFTGQFTSYNNT